MAPGKRQADGSRVNHSAATAAPQVGDPPKNALIAADQMAADVMEAWRLTAYHVHAAGLGEIEAIKRSMDFDVIEQRCTATRQSFPIDCGSRHGNRPCRVRGDEQ